MNKKLTAKTQRLDPIVEQTSSAFSKGIILEPETREIQLKKGSIYAVYGVAGDASFDTKLINTVVHDVIHDTYYQSDSISPIQSLEKAIVEARDKVVQLSNDSVRQTRPTIRFDIIAGVLWGNVLYLVQYGEYNAFLVREGTVKPISTTAEGNFAAASGVVKDDDVVILSTDDFSSQYPPQKLLTTTISEQDLEPTEACLLLKFNVDTTFSSDEVVDFGLEGLKEKKTGPSVVTVAVTHFKEAIEKIGKSLKKFQKPKPIAVIASPPPPRIRTGPYKLATIFANNYVRMGGIALISALLMFSVIAGLVSKFKGGSEKSQATTEQPVQEVAIQPEPEPEPPKPVINVEEDTKNKVIRVKPEAIYDLKIADSTAEPTEIAAFADKIVVADKNYGKLYYSKLDTPKFEQLSQIFAGINSIANFDGSLAFADNEGFKFMDLATNKLTQSYKQTGLTMAAAYSTFIYSISSETLNKFTKSDDTLKSAVWARNEEINGAKSFVVAYNIYIATKNNDIVSYLSGEKTDLKVKGLPTPFSEISKMVTTVDFKNIYVADKGSKSLVVLNKDGTYLKQYKPEDISLWGDIRSIDISADEKTAYILDGSRIYKLTLE